MKDWESSTVLLRGVKDVYWSDFGFFGLYSSIVLMGDWESIFQMSTKSNGTYATLRLDFSRSLDCKSPAETSLQIG